MKLPKWLDWRREPRRRSTDRVAAFTSQVGIGTLLHGTLTGQGCYHIQGEFVGHGEIDGTLVLAAGAYWKGNITADFVQVSGKVDGHVVARAKIDLAPTAVVSGDLSAPVLTIAEGAQYEGTIGRPPSNRVTRYAERRGQGVRKAPV